MATDQYTLSPLADDRLIGVNAIAKFRGEPRRRTQYLIDSGQLPHGREGKRIVASKRVLLAHWAKLTGGELCPGRSTEAA